MTETQEHLNGIVADVMFAHIGREHAITYRELARETKLPMRTVRNTIKSLIEDEGAAIGTSSNRSTGGYYGIATEEERDRALNELDVRILSLQARRAALASAELCY